MLAARGEPWAVKSAGLRHRGSANGGSGTVRVAGADLNSLSESGLATWRGRHVGLVFQFFQLLPTLTVAENVLTW